jgi:hypothetical protein
MHYLIIAIVLGALGLGIAATKTYEFFAYDGEVRANLELQDAEALTQAPPKWMQPKCPDACRAGE